MVRMLKMLKMTVYSAVDSKLWKPWVGRSAHHRKLAESKKYLPLAPARILDKQVEMSMGSVLMKQTAKTAKTWSGTSQFHSGAPPAFASSRYLLSVLLTWTNLQLLNCLVFCPRVRSFLIWSTFSCNPFPLLTCSVNGLQVAAGGTHSVVLTEDGHVWGWGQPWPPGDM